jgi:hypothetical protein
MSRRAKNGRKVAGRAYAVAVAALLIVPVGVFAAPALHALPANVQGPIFADSTHLVWQDSAGLHAVGDGARWSSAKSFVPPADCGRIKAAGAGRALYSCSLSETVAVPKLVDLETGETAVPPGTDRLIDYEKGTQAAYTPFELGSQLIGIAIGDYKVSAEMYLDWRTGARLLPVIRPSARRVLSLDVPDARRTLCSPLRITTHLEEDDFGDQVEVFDQSFYRPPYLVLLQSHQLILRKCGSHKAATLATKPSTVLATSTYVAWTTPTRLHILRFRERKASTWPLPSRGKANLVGTNGSLVISLHGDRSIVDLTPRRPL